MSAQDPDKARRNARTRGLAAAPSKDQEDHRTYRLIRVVKLCMWLPVAILLTPRCVEDTACVDTWLRGQKFKRRQARAAP